MAALLKHVKKRNAEEAKGDGGNRLSNPLEMSTNVQDYQYELDLPCLRDMSSELLLMLSTRFRLAFQIDPTELEMKIQKLLDSTQAKISNQPGKGLFNAQLASYNSSSSQSQTGATG